MSLERRIRKAARVPIVAYRRRRYPAEGYALLMVEAISYRRSIYHFAKAVQADPSFRNDYPLDESSVVADFGAYRGEWAIEMVERYGCQVHAYEPVPSLFERAIQATAAHPTVTVWPFGLAGADEEVEFNVAGPGSSSMPGSGGGFEGDRVPVRIRDVAAALDELDVPRIHLCKLNIEGAEYDVLDRMAATGWFERVDHFQIQFHDFHPDAFRRRRRVRRALRRTHVQEWNYDWVFESWRHRGR